MLPTLRGNPDEIILHLGTNDLQNDTPRQVAEGIINLMDYITQNSSAKVTVSNLVQRTDDPAMHAKVRETNKILKKFAGNRDLNIILKRHYKYDVKQRSALKQQRIGSSRKKHLSSSSQ